MRETPHYGQKTQKGIKFIPGVFILILSIACMNDWAEQPIVVTQPEFAVYWSELERRWPSFFKGQCVTPLGLPFMDDVFEMVTFIEIEASDRFPTCTYQRSSATIRIGDDKWASGCVPHEIGHAACHFLGVEVCRDFEHPNYKSRC